MDTKKVAADTSTVNFGANMRRLWMPVSLLIFSACSEGITDTPSAGPHSALLPRQGTLVTIDDEFEDLNKQLSGFAGLYVNENDGATIMLQNIADSTRAKEVIRPFLTRRFGFGRGAELFDRRVLRSRRLASAN